MKRKVAVLDVLFPKVRATMLRLLFCAPPKQRYIRELTRLSGLALCTVQDELRKLRAIGLVTSWSNGYHRYHQANKRHPLFADLLHIAQASERLPGARHAALYRKHPRPHSKRRPGTKALPTDRLVKWDLFSRQTRVRRSTA